MADPLTALIHAVQVMNFLRTLIMKTLRERGDLAAAEYTLSRSCSESPTDNEGANASEKSVGGVRDHDPLNFSAYYTTSFNKLLTGSSPALDCDPEERSEVDNCESISGRSSPTITCNSDIPRDGSESGFSNGDAESMDRFSFKEGIRKLCRHPVFQLSKSTRKPGEVVVMCAGKEC